MWSTSGTTVSLLGATKDNSQRVIALVENIISTNLLREEKLLKFYIEKRPTEGKGAQVAIKITFPDEVPNFLVDLSRTPWSVWPQTDGFFNDEEANCKSQDSSLTSSLILAQSVERIEFPPDHMGVKKVMIEGARLAIVPCSRLSTMHQNILFESSLWKSTLQDEEKLQLSSELDGISIALSLAAGFLSTFDVPVVGYLSMVKNEKGSRRSDLYPGTISAGPPKYAYIAVNVSVNVSLSYLSLISKEALETLSLACLLGGQAIPEKLLIAPDETSGNSATGVLLLERLNFVSRIDNLLTIEPIINLTICQWLRNESYFKATERLAYGRIAAYMPPAGIGDWEAFNPCIFSAETVLDLPCADPISKYNRSIIVLSLTKGNYYTAGYRAQTYEVENIREQVFAEDDSSCFFSKCENGFILVDSRIYDQALNKASKICGVRDIMKCNSEAVRILEERLHQISQTDDRVSKEQYQTRICLGIGYARQKRWDQARQAVSMALKEQKKVVALSDSACRGTISVLVDIAFRQDKMHELAEIYEAEVEEFERVLGPTHAQTLKLLTEYAIMYGTHGAPQQKERCIKTESLHRTLYERHSSVYGSHNPTTITHLRYVAFSLYFQDRYAEAEEVFRRVLPLMEKYVGYLSTSTVEVRYYLGVLRHLQDDIPAALEYYSQALAGYIQDRGPDHPLTQGCRDIYALALKQNPTPRLELEVTKTTSGNVSTTDFDVLSRRSSVASSASGWTFRSLGSIKSSRTVMSLRSLGRKIR